MGRRRRRKNNDNNKATRQGRTTRKNKFQWVKWWYLLRYFLVAFFCLSRTKKRTEERENEESIKLFVKHNPEKCAFKWNWKTWISTCLWQPNGKYIYFLVYLQQRTLRSAFLFSSFLLPLPKLIKFYELRNEIQMILLISPSLLSMSQGVVR